MSETLARRPRLDGGERCRALCDAAETVFLREGYAAASMDEVARQAGMSKRTLYQNFASKAALFEAMIAAAMAPLHIDTALEDEPDLRKALVGLLETAARHLLAPRQAEIFRLVIGELKRSPDMASAFHRGGPGRGAGSLQRRIALEQERGRLRPGDAQEAASTLYGMAIGKLQLKQLLGIGPPPTDAEISVRVREAVNIFLEGTSA